MTAYTVGDGPSYLSDSLRSSLFSMVMQRGDISLMAMENG